MRRAARWTFVLSYGLLILGFWFHRSEHPTLGPYSLPYLASLVAITLPLGLPWILTRLGQRFGARRAAFSLLPLIAVCSVVYLGVRLHFELTHTYPFDPFLQLHPVDLEEQYPVARLDPETLRIACFGGSTTRNAMLAAAKRYPRQLESLLRARRPASSVQVLNAGQDWFTTRHSLIHYVTHVDSWQPDVVIVMHGINDLVRSFAPPEFSLGERDPAHYTHFYGPAANAARNQTFEGRLLNGPLRPLSQRWFSRLRFEFRDYPVERFDTIGAFEANLRRIVRFARSQGAVPVLMTQPALYKPRAAMSQQEWTSVRHSMAPRVLRERTGTWSEAIATPGSIAAALAAFNDVTRRIAREEATTLVEAAERMPKDASHFRDGVHYTERGAALLAQTVADQLPD